MFRIPGSTRASCSSAPPSTTRCSCTSSAGSSPAHSGTRCSRRGFGIWFGPCSESSSITFRAFWPVATSTKALSFPEKQTSKVDFYLRERLIILECYFNSSLCNPPIVIYMFKLSQNCIFFKLN